MRASRKPRYLLIGSDGLIGHAIRNQLIQDGNDVWETTRRSDTVTPKRLYLDLTLPITQWVVPPSVDVTYFCTGTPSIQYCEEYPMLSRVINVSSIMCLAKKLRATPSKIIFLSSNLVYNGKTPFQRHNTRLSPRCEYGRQKASVEKQLKTLGGPVIILRSTKIFSAHMPLFMEWMVALKQKKIIHPFSDKTVSPLPLSYIVRVLYYLSTIERAGTFQISGEKDVTYADIAWRIAQYLGVHRQLVQPRTMREAHIDISREPAYTTLKTSSVFLRTRFAPPKVWDTIDWMIHEHGVRMQT